MHALWQDLRYAFRTLFRQPTFTLTAVLTLALGIGANSAIFSVVNTVLLRPLPYPEPEELVMVWGRYPEFGRTSTSAPDFRDWRDGVDGFEYLSAVANTRFNLTGGGEPVHLRGSLVTADFFRTFGVQPALGRGFAPEEAVVGGPAVVVLSDRLWRGRFAADSDVVGKTVSLNDRPHTVVGVMPPGFEFGDEIELWGPLYIDNEDFSRRAEFLSVVGRLAPGVTVQQAQLELDAVVQRLAQLYPETNASIRGEVVGMQADLVADARPALLVFSAAVALVLLIACANVANLLLARASGRTREIAVRLALGAGRGRLVRQLLTESVLLSVLGAGAGLLLAAWGVDALRASGTTFVPRLADVRIDRAVVVFSLVLGVATGLLFGLAPATRLIAGDTMPESLKEGARGATGGGVRFRSALVLAEAALAIVLLAGAGLLIRSFTKLNQIDPGFDPRGVLTYELVLPPARYEIDRLPQVYERILGRARAIPGVTAAAVSSDLPLESPNYITLEIEGRADEELDGGDVQALRVSSGYFTVHRIPLRSGRLIGESDVASTDPVAVVNEQFVRQYMEGRDPIGVRLRVQDGSPEATIVGVVGDVAHEGVAEQPYPQVYQPIAQGGDRSVRVAMRTDGDPIALMEPAREALAEVDPLLPLSRLATMEDRLSGTLTQPRVSMAVLAVFAALALVLAAIGIYGVLSYAIAQRTREIGIRMALGARPNDVRRLVIGQGMRPVLGGVIVGVGGALLLTRLMASLLYGIEPSDPLTFAGVALLLTGVGFVASWVPARRATRVDALVALRSE